MLAIGGMMFTSCEKDEINALEGDISVLQAQVNANTSSIDALGQELTAAQAAVSAALQAAGETLDAAIVSFSNSLAQAQQANAAALNEVIETASIFFNGLNEIKLIGNYTIGVSEGLFILATSGDGTLFAQEHGGELTKNRLSGDHISSLYADGEFGTPTTEEKHTVELDVNGIKYQIWMVAPTQVGDNYIIAWNGGAARFDLGIDEGHNVNKLLLNAIQGERGPRGSVGPQGPQGPAGAQGPIGPAGQDGADGADGDDGDDGDDGNDGNDGQDGDDAEIPVPTVALSLDKTSVAWGESITIDATITDASASAQLGWFEVTNDGNTVASYAGEFGESLTITNNYDSTGITFQVLFRLVDGDNTVDMQTEDIVFLPEPDSGTNSGTLNEDGLGTDDGGQVGEDVGEDDTTPVDEWTLSNGVYSNPTVSGITFTITSATGLGGTLEYTYTIADTTGATFDGGFGSESLNGASGANAAEADAVAAAIALINSRS